jgi:hypothetical protein
VPKFFADELQNIADVMQRLGDLGPDLGLDLAPGISTVDLSITIRHGDAASAVVYEKDSSQWVFIT